MFHVCTQLKNGVQKQTRHRPLIVAPDILSPDPTQEVRQKWAIGHAVSDFCPQRTLLLTLDSQNAFGAVQYNDPGDGADDQVRIIGPGPRDQNAGGDDPPD